MNRSYSWLGFLVIVTLLALGTGAWVGRNSPEHAVRQMIRALQTQDRLRLEAFLDEPRLAEALVNGANQQTLAETRGHPESADRDLYLGLSLGRGGQVEMARATIRETVACLTDPVRGRSASEKRAIEKMRITSVRRAEHAAVVEIIFPKPDANGSVRIVAHLERSGGIWRLIGLTDPAAYAQAASRRGGIPTMMSPPHRPLIQGKGPCTRLGSAAVPFLLAWIAVPAHVG